MKRPFICLAVMAMIAIPIMAGCGQAAVAPTPTTVQPAKAAEPTKAPAAPTAIPSAPTTAPATGQTPAVAPTAASTQKTSFPEKGRPITIIVPWGAGDTNDNWARLIASFMEKDLGTSIQVSNKAGAGSQVGTTEIAKSKPDGYTLGLSSFITASLIYLDPERQAVFSRKDFQTVALVSAEPPGIVVKADGPYKTTKDLVNAAKAAPGNIKIGDNGHMTPTNMQGFLFQKSAGITIAPVHFNSVAETASAVLGGHVDGGVGSAGGLINHIKAGTMRMLGVGGNERVKSIPDVETFAAQGYPGVNIVISRGFFAPAGVPKDVVEVLDSATKKILENPEFIQKADAAGLPIKYLNSTQLGNHWEELENLVKPLLEEAKKSTS